MFDDRNKYLTIYTVYHCDNHINEYNLVNDEFHKLYAVHHNYPGESINYANRIVNEAYALYYVWKNQLKSDFVGFEHYRRRFSRLYFDMSHLNNTKCYVMYLDKQSWYVDDDGKFDTEYNILFSFLDQSYVDYLKNGPYIIGCSCFVMGWENFNKMCQQVFNIMFEYDRRLEGNLNIKNYLHVLNNDYMRIRWNMMERIVSAYIYMNFGLDNIVKVNYFEHNNKDKNRLHTNI